MPLDPTPTPFPADHRAAVQPVHERVRRVATRRSPGRPAGRPAGSSTVTDREQLLEAAERLIRAVGPSVSMEEIAMEAGVSKPVLYHHVGNRDALIEALSSRHVARINQAIDAAVSEATDSRGAVRQFVAAFFQVIDRDRHLFLFLAAGGAGHTWPERALLFADHSARPLAEALRQQRTAEGTDPSVADAWAYGLIGLLHFVTLWWIRERALTTDQVVDHVVELVWSGLGPKHVATEQTRIKQSRPPRK